MPKKVLAFAALVAVCLIVASATIQFPTEIPVPVYGPTTLNAAGHLYCSDPKYIVIERNTPSTWVVAEEALKLFLSHGCTDGKKIPGSKSYISIEGGEKYGSVLEIRDVEQKDGKTYYRILSSQTIYSLKDVEKEVNDVLIFLSVERNSRIRKENLVEGNTRVDETYHFRNSDLALSGRDTSITAPGESQ